MGLITLSEYQTHLGRAITDPTEVAAIQSIIDAMSAAILTSVAPLVFTPQAIDVVVDAPVSTDLICPVRPLRQVDALYFNPRGHYDPSRFTADTLVDPARYHVVRDEVVGSVYQSRSGLIRRHGSIWGVGLTRDVGALAARLTPLPGAIRLVAQVGYLTVPEEIKLACCLAVTLIARRKLFGAPVSSESWNGYSYSLDTSLLDSPLKSAEIASVLRPYQTIGSM